MGTLENKHKARPVRHKLPFRGAVPWRRVSGRTVCDVAASVFRGRCLDSRCWILPKQWLDRARFQSAQTQTTNYDNILIRTHRGCLPYLWVWSASGEFAVKVVGKAFDELGHKLSMRHSRPHIFRQILVDVVDARLGKVRSGRSCMPFAKLSPAAGAASGRSSSSCSVNNAAAVADIADRCTRAAAGRLAEHCRRFLGCRTGAGHSHIVNVSSLKEATTRFIFWRSSTQRASS